jgi:hypothetical protein
MTADAVFFAVGWPANLGQLALAAAQKICRRLGIGRFPQAWSYLGSDD